MIPSPQSAPAEPMVIGGDQFAAIAECDGIRYYLTPCCDASAKGSSNSPTGICCRACYRPIAEQYAAVPGPLTVTLSPAFTWAEYHAAGNPDAMAWV